MGTRRYYFSPDEKRVKEICGQFSSLVESGEAHADAVKVLATTLAREEAAWADAERRAERLESKNVGLQARLEAVQLAASGVGLSDFMESFEDVRAVVALRDRAERLETALRELAELIQENNPALARIAAALADTKAAALSPEAEEPRR